MSNYYGGDLKRTKKMLAKLNMMRQEVVDLRNELECNDGLEGIKYNGMPALGKIGDPTLEVVAVRDLTETRLRNTERLVNRIDRALNMLPKHEKDIIERRYVHFMPWKIIAVECGYTRDGAYKAGQRGLRKVSFFLLVGTNGV